MEVWTRFSFLPIRIVVLEVTDTVSAILLLSSSVSVEPLGEGQLGSRFNIPNKHMVDKCVCFVYFHLIILNWGLRFSHIVASLHRHIESPYHSLYLTCMIRIFLLSVTSRSSSDTRRTASLPLLIHIITTTLCMEKSKVVCVHTHIGSHRSYCTKKKNRVSSKNRRNKQRFQATGWVGHEKSIRLLQTN